MPHIRVLLVDDQAEVRASISRYLAQQEPIQAIHEARTGMEALQVLACTPIDVVVTDLILPQMDGYALLEEMLQLSLNPKPRVIALTALTRDDFVTRAIERGAAYYMVKPFDIKQLCARVLEAAQRAEPDPAALPRQAAHILGQPRSLDERISALFLTMGVPASIKGFSFLRDAVRRVAENPDLLNRITKELYPAVAERFDTTTSRVERAIRHAIEVVWRRGHIEALNRVYGCEVCKRDEKPSNGELIAMIADKLNFEHSA